MATSNTRFTQNRLGQSKNPIDSDHGIYRYWDGAIWTEWVSNGGQLAIDTVPIPGYD